MPQIFDAQDIPMASPQRSNFWHAAKQMAVLFVLSVGLSGLTPAASAQEKNQAPLPTVIVVDLQAIIRDSLAVKSIDTQLQERNVVNQAKVDERQAAIEEKQVALRSKRDDMSPEEFQKQAAAIEQEFKAHQEDVKNIRVTLEGKMQTSMRSVRNTLQGIVFEIAEKRKATLILSRSAVIGMSQEFDVTKDALEILNTRLPETELPE